MQEVAESVRRDFRMPNTHGSGDYGAAIYVADDRSAALVEMGVPGLSLSAAAWTTVDGLRALRDKLNAVLVDVDG